MSSLWHVSFLLVCEQRNNGKTKRCTSRKIKTSRNYVEAGLEMKIGIRHGLVHNIVVVAAIFEVSAGMTVFAYGAGD